jgi:hypothetical protein
MHAGQVSMLCGGKVTTRTCWLIVTHKDAVKEVMRIDNIGHIIN